MVAHHRMEEDAAVAVRTSRGGGSATCARTGRASGGEGAPCTWRTRRGVGTYTRAEGDGRADGRLHRAGVRGFGG